MILFNAPLGSMAAASKKARLSFGPSAKAMHDNFESREEGGGGLAILSFVFVHYFLPDGHFHLSTTTLLSGV
jgi:hypothetical protein